MFLAEIEAVSYSVLWRSWSSDRRKQNIYLTNVVNLQGDRIAAAESFKVSLMNNSRCRVHSITTLKLKFCTKSALIILPNRSITKFLHDNAAICGMGSDDAYRLRGIVNWGNPWCTWPRYMYVDGYKDQIEFCNRPVQSWCPHIEHVLKRLQEISRNRPDVQELLLQICTNILQDWPDEDAYTGPVAEIAILLGNEDLFLNALKCTPHGFCRNSWRRFGEALDLWNLVISEENIIMALKKSWSFCKIYQDMLHFRQGLEQQFGKPYEIACIRGWTDGILMKFLNQTTEVRMRDYPALVDMIVRRKSHHFYQFVAYQNVRQFASRMLGHYGFASGILLELCIRLQNTDPSCNFLTSLSELVQEQAISEFDFEEVIRYIFYRVRPNGFGKDTIFQSLVRLIGPQNQGRLLKKMGSESHYLVQQRHPKLIESILSGIVVAIEKPSSEARECFKSLFLAYSSILMGDEPVRPDDLSRPEEVKDEVVRSRACLDEINALLKDPVVNFTQV